MAMGRPKAPLVLTPEQREQLNGIVKSRSLPAGLVSRARIVLLSAAGKTNQAIARQLGVTNATVGKWRRRFLEQDVTGLHDELRPGRPRSVSDERVAGLVRKTLETKPKDGTHWSVRQIARETRLAKSTVHRIWQAFGLEPHRQRHFKLSNDPFFGAQLATHYNPLRASDTGASGGGNGSAGLARSRNPGPAQAQTGRYPGPISGIERDRE